MRVTVIVVNHDTSAMLEACVAAYDAQDHEPLEIVVVDNASADDAPQVLDALEARRWRHHLRVVRNTTNRGFAGAVNDVVASSDAEAVLLSNVDVVAQPTMVSNAVRALLADNDRGTVQPLLVRPGTERVRRIDTTGHVIDAARIVRNRGEGCGVDEAPCAGEVFGASGAVVLHRRQMLDEVAWHTPAGPQVLTEALFAYFEDVELDWRARRFGWTAWFEPAAIATHERGGLGERRSPFVDELNWANRLLVTITCDDPRSLARSAWLALPVFFAHTARLAATHPAALRRGVARVRHGLRPARIRRRQLDRRAPRTAAEVADEWVVPFRPAEQLRVWRHRRRRRARDGQSSSASSSSSSSTISSPEGSSTGSAGSGAAGRSDGS